MRIECKYDEMMSLSELKKRIHPDNENKHSEDQIRSLSKVIARIGIRHPIHISKLTGKIAGGHGRLMSFQKLGYDEAPIVWENFIDDIEEINYRASDNIGQYAEFNNDLYVKNLEIAGIDISEIDLEEFGVIDYEIPEIESLDPQTDEDEVPEVESPITRRGDIWLLGKHRLMCGDSTMIDDVEKLMNGEKADLLHTDPPYNVNYSNTSRPKAGKQDLGYIKNDKMDSDNFYQFLYDAFICGYEACKQDSMAYVWHASSEHINFTQALIDSGWGYNQQIIWKKPMLLGRGKYQWAHEPCLTGVKGKPWFTDDRTKTTVWDFGGYDKSKNIHPTQKPVFIPEEAINNSSKEGSIILDLFGGSGSTLIAAEKTNRKCNTMELDVKFVDKIINRWQNYTGKKATLESTGQTYEELKNERL